MNFYKSILRSKYLFYILVAVIATQMVHFALIIKFGVPPDEGYHVSAARYFSQLGPEAIFKGFQQDPNTLPDVQILSRTNNVIYPYLMGQGMKVLNILGLSFDNSLTIMRLVNVCFAAGTLFVLRKIFREVTSDKLISNLTFMLLAVTGTFIWTGAAVNYDNLANLLVALFMLTGLRFLGKPSITKLSLLLILALATVLTKYTFMPTLALLITVLLFMPSGRNFTKSLFLSIKNLIKRPRVNTNISGFAKTIAIIGASVLLLIVFYQRPVSNYLTYGSLEPECSKIFTQEECSQNDLYKRNYDARLEVDKKISKGTLSELKLITHTGRWVSAKYTSTYFYLGSEVFVANDFEEVIFGICFTWVLLLLIVRKRSLWSRASAKKWYILIAFVALYIAFLYAYNLKTFIDLRQYYGYQGRYLIPVLPYIYLLVVLIIYNFYRELSNNISKFIVAFISMALALFFMSSHQPYTQFKNKTNEKWYITQGTADSRKIEIGSSKLLLP